MQVHPSQAEMILAGVDLGSNSFHMVIARVSERGRFTFIDRRKEYVRLAGGLRPDGSVDPEVRKRALDCLARFGERLATIPPANVRIVGTNTFRKAKDVTLLQDAKKAIGRTIHVVSGHEEARLVYQGVAMSNQDAGTRLVVDIGGGSTEFILGHEGQIRALASHYCGCVGWTMRFFPDGKMTRERMKRATLAARREVGNDVRRFRELYDVALGSSGTINAIERVVLELGFSDEGITRKSLKMLVKHLCEIGDISKIKFDSVSDDRAQVLPGGLAILKGVFRALDVQEMRAVPTALREGVLLDLWGRKQNQDIRQSTVELFQERFEVDVDQAVRVRDTALSFFDQMAEALGISLRPFRSWLQYASELHEVGLFLGFPGYHKHSAYLLANGELPGFSWQEQRAIAALAIAHRGRFDLERMQDLRPGKQLPLELVLMLRVARRLHRRRSPKALPTIVATASQGSMRLEFPEGWLEERPLTIADLERERQEAERVGLEFGFK